MAQSVGRPTSAQVMISPSVGSRPASGSVLTAQSLEPVSDSVSPSLSLCPSPVHALSLSVSKINVKKKLKLKYNTFRRYEKTLSFKTPSPAPSPCGLFLKWKHFGAPGWLSRLGVRLRLRSQSCAPWVRAPRQVLCWRLGAWSLPRILCLPLSLPLTHSHSVSISQK